jgi:hypothetical protein
MPVDVARKELFDADSSMGHSKWDCVENTSGGSTIGKKSFASARPIVATHAQNLIIGLRPYRFNLGHKLLDARDDVKRFLAAVTYGSWSGGGDGCVGASL